MAIISDYEIFSFNRVEMERYLDCLLSAIAMDELPAYKSMLPLLEDAIEGIPFEFSNAAKGKEVYSGLYELGCLVRKLSSYEAPLRQAKEYLKSMLSDMALDAHIHDDWTGQGNPN